MINQNLYKRVIALVIDQTFSNVIVIGGGFLVIILGYYKVASAGRHEHQAGFEFFFLLTVIVFDWFYNWFKDFSDGRSFGKRIAGIQVFDLRSGKPATGLQTLARNLTLVLFPVEVLFVLLRQDSRRMGDLLAGTYVADYNFQPSRMPRIPYLVFPISLSLLFSLVLTSPIIYFVYSNNDNSRADDVNYINAEQSRSATLLGKDLYQNEFKDFEVEIYNLPDSEGNRLRISIYAETKTNSIILNPQSMTLQLRSFCDGIVGDTNYTAVVKFVLKDRGSGYRQVPIR